MEFQEEIIEITFKEFNKMINTSKLDLGSNYFYTGIFDLFSTGIGFRHLSGILFNDRHVDKFTFKVIDVDEDLSISYTTSELESAYSLTKYKYGIRKPDVGALKTYFKNHAITLPKIKDKRNKVTNNISWVDTVRDLVPVSFIEEILTSIPEYLADDLERVIYVYYLLCNKFSYDYKFFINKEKDEIKHLNYNNVSNIFKDNLTICYEFNMIFALIAEQLGFKSTIADIIINSDNVETIIPIDDIEDYKNEHYSLLLDDNKHKVYFDSTRGSLVVDLVNVKTGRNINGIKAFNDEQSSYLDYKVEKVYEIFLKEYNIEKSTDYIPNIEIEKSCRTINESIESIKKGDTELVYVSLEDKLNAYIDMSKTINLRTMDEVSFLYIMYKNIFHLEKEMVKFRIIKTKEEDYQDELPVVVLAIDDHQNNISNRRYYVYEIGKGFNKYNGGDMAEKLFNKQYEVFDKEYTLS